MKYLKEFDESDQVSYDTLAQELFELKENGIDDVFTLVTMHAGLGRLEFFDMVIQNAIRNYDTQKNWRDEVGEIT